MCVCVCHPFLPSSCFLLCHFFNYPFLLRVPIDPEAGPASFRLRACLDSDYSLLSSPHSLPSHTELHTERCLHTFQHEVIDCSVCLFVCYSESAWKKCKSFFVVREDLLMWVCSQRPQPEGRPGCEIQSSVLTERRCSRLCRLCINKVPSSGVRPVPLCRSLV